MRTRLTTVKGGRGSGGIQVRMLGGATLVSNISKLAKGFSLEVLPALMKALQPVLVEAKSLTPVESGRLRNSGRIVKVKVGPKLYTVEIRFGGAGIPEAVPIHEHLSMHSPPSWRSAEQSGAGVHFTVGGPKYLERPILKAASGVLIRVLAVELDLKKVASKAGLKTGRPRN